MIALAAPVHAVRLGAAVLALAIPAAAQTRDSSNAAALRPGVAVTFTPAGGGAPLDDRVQRQLALRVPEGGTVTPFVDRADYAVTFRGVLRLDRRYRLRFSLVGTGSAELRIDDHVVASRSGTAGAGPGESKRWKKGDHAVTLTYTPPATGAAHLRVEWQSRKFGVEPVPSTVLFHEPTPGLKVASANRRGRELLARYQCARCHALPDPEQLGGRRGMPELHDAVPTLSGIGSRVLRPWLEQWIRDPRSLRRHARMPSLLPAATASTEAAHLAAYLLQSGPPPSDQQPKFRRSQARAGGRHFRALGCIGCHVLPGVSPVPDAAGMDDRIELTEVDRKWRPSALVAFLQNPSAIHRGTRMPNFDLTEREATELTAFLLRQAARVRGNNGSAESPPDEPPLAGSGDPALGRKLYQDRGCMGCHGLPGPSGSQAWEPPGAALVDLSDARGCLALEAKRDGEAPDFGWERSAHARLDREALVAVLGVDGQREATVASLARTTPSEYAQRQIRDLRCVVCHDRDGQRARLLSRSAEIAKLPELEVEGEEVLQDRPSLTFAGEKLRTEWTAKLLRGDLDRRARPWLHMRMPSFGARADALALGLADQHGFGPPIDPGAAGDQAGHGRRLVGKKGFACTTCHSVGETHPDAVFEVLGVNLALVRERLRPGFYRRWMLDPRRISPSTRMPQYADDQGKTAVQLLESDAKAQFDAIYDFLRAGRGVKL